MIDAELRKTAELARLNLSDEEHERLRGEVENVLSYFDSMAAAEAAQGGATAYAVDDNPFEAGGNGAAGARARSVSQLRPDRIRTESIAETLLESAGDVEDRFIAIPNVL